MLQFKSRMSASRKARIVDRCVRRPLWYCACTLLLTSFTVAQKYPYTDYVDRKEGIVTSQKLVAGEKLDLISASVENEEPFPGKNASACNLGFYLPESARVAILVRELEKLYQLEPKRRDYSTGISRFSWPSDILQFYGLTLKDLLPLGRIYSAGSEWIIPIILFYQRPTSNQLRYSFCFLPRSSVTRLAYAIYRSGSAVEVYANTLGGIHAGDKARISWDGRDKNNVAQQSGPYELLVKATFNPSPGKPAQVVTSKYRFYYHAGLLGELAR